MINFAATPTRRSSLALGTALALSASLAVAATGVRPAEATEAQVTYTASSATIANPERGFYSYKTQCDKDPFDVVKLKEYRVNDGVTLVMCIFYLHDYRTTAIAESVLTFFDQQAAAVRAAGMKMVLRFAYSKIQGEADASVDQVLAHLTQMAPHLKANADVIDVMESGFVGTWGEGAYSTNFGDIATITATDWANRKKVVDKILAVLPATRMVQLRTPRMKRTMFGTTPVSSTTAYNGSALSRLGHHNDCFLASSSDQGTYQNTAVEYPYLQADTKYVAMGGETCALHQPRTDCPTALSELAMFHWSYLNRDRKAEVLSNWDTQGCLTQVGQRLGYRFSLVSSQFPSKVMQGSTFPAQISVKNAGWASPHNPRPAYLVLRKTSNGAITRVKLASDPRRWAAGATTAIAENISVPVTMPTGTYELLLSLPDPTSTLTKRPEYAVRMANIGTWEAATGLNKLLTTITVTPQGVLP
jgi:hypothetical protein